MKRNDVGCYGEDISGSTTKENVMSAKRAYLSTTEQSGCVIVNNKVM
jgi:hypothetical protein